MVQVNELRELAGRIYDAQQIGQTFTLFLGSECARAAGVPTVSQMAYTYFEEEMSIAPYRVKQYLSPDEWARIKYNPREAKQHLVDIFYEMLSQKSVPARVSILNRFYSQVPVPKFYYELARLISRGYFQQILTTNIDTLLEQALTSIGLGSANFRVISLGASRTRRSQSFVDPSIPVLIIKLHGDLLQEDMAFSPQEIEATLSPYRMAVKGELSGQTLMVGYTLESPPINSWLSYTSGPMWWVNIERPSTDQQQSIIGGREITYFDGTSAHLDIFFSALAAQLAAVEKEIGGNSYGDNGQNLESFPFEPVEKSGSGDHAIVAPGTPDVPPDELETQLKVQYLQQQIRQGYTALSDLEREKIATGQSSIQIQSQLGFKKREIYSLEDDLRDLTHSHDEVLSLVESIKTAAQKSEIDPDAIEYLEFQIQTLRQEFKDDPGNQHLIAAALGSISLLVERIGQDAIGSELTDQLFSIAPSIVTRRV